MRTPAIDAWLASVERVDDARRAALEQLARLAPTLEGMVERVASGTPFSRVVQPRTVRMRQRVVDAIGELSAAIAENRAATVRVLIDDEGRSVTDVARLYEIPRQVASRLYHRTDDGETRSSGAR
jgi:hypothetical protein